MRAGVSLLELVIAGAILAVLAAAMYDLFSMQRQEVAGSGRQLLLNAHALRRLAEEESRLNVVRFSSPSTFVTTKAPSGEGLGFTEALSVEPAEGTTGLWKLTIVLIYADATAHTTRSIAVARLIADRDHLTRLPASVRVVP